MIAPPPEEQAPNAVDQRAAQAALVDAFRMADEAAG